MKIVHLWLNDGSVIMLTGVRYIEVDEYYVAAWQAGIFPNLSLRRNNIARMKVFG